MRHVFLKSKRDGYFAILEVVRIDDAKIRSDYEGCLVGKTVKVLDPLLFSTWVISKTHDGFESWDISRFYGGEVTPLMAELV